jgi:hypothetical protein
MATGRAWCPKHQIPVPQTKRIPAAWVERPDGSWRHLARQAIRLSGVCRQCRGELYEQLADEYQPEQEETMNDSTTDQIIEGEIEHAGELVVREETVPAGAPTLFGTTDPARIVARVTEIATMLADIIDQKHLYASISGKKYVTVEGWQMLGAFTGLVAYTVWSRRVGDEGWESRVEIRRVSDGQPLAAAESECLRSERKWARADDHALRSMSQTRAVSKAFRLAVGFVMSLSGYEATPFGEVADAAFEEIPAGKPVTDVATVEDKGTIPPDRQPTGEQGERLRAALHDLAELDPDTDWHAHALSLAGIPGWDHATATIVDVVIDGLEAELRKEAA